ncbi:MAG: hypothetical protein ABW068_14145 [Candidatus Thiodiazotropha sp.]
MIFVSGEDEVSSAEDKEPESWWEKRHLRSDLYFPHKAHEGVMSSSDDACMACHPFNENRILEPQQLQTVQQIYNEPLEAICHSCHMLTRSAPMACEVCHTDMTTVRPADHMDDFTRLHGEAARVDQQGCSDCHIDLNFCTDCHFRRSPGRRVMHPLGYRDRHGLDARIDPTSCGGCHQANYCRDCHRGSLR